MENIFNNKKNNSVVTQIFIILMNVIFLLFIFANDLISIEFLSLLCIISFVIQISYLIKIMNNLLNPVVIFSVIFHLFSSGQIFLHVFDLKRGNFDVYNRLNQEVLITAIVFLTLAYSFFQLGVILTVRKSNIYFQSYNILSTYRHDTIYKFGMLLFVIGIVPYMYNLLYSFIFISSQGYSSYYESGVRLNNIFVGIGYYIYPGLIFIIIGGKRLLKKIAIIFLVFIAIVSLLSGDRGTAIVTFLSAYMLYVYFLQDGKYNLITLGLMITVLSAFVPIIAIFRHSATTSQNIDYFSLLTQDNIFISTLDNLGVTLWPLGKIIELIPEYDNFLFGKSYIASIVYLIPSFLRIGPLNEISLIILSPANWLMQTLSMSYGPGFTPFAEAYLNFGWYGILFMTFFGKIFTKLLMFKVKEENNLAITYGMSILNFLFFAMSVRGSINITISYFVRYVLLPFVILMFLIKEKNRKTYK